MGERGNNTPTLSPKARPKRFVHPEGGAGFPTDAADEEALRRIGYFEEGYPRQMYKDGEEPCEVISSEEERALGECWDVFDEALRKIGGSYRKRYKAAVNNPAKQASILDEYRTLHPALARADSWYKEREPKISELQTQAMLKLLSDQQAEDQERRAIEAKATARLAAAPAPAEARKDTPERNTWQKKLDDPIKYEWMTIPETMRALGNCSNKTVYRKLDEGKLEYHSSVKPIRVKTVSVIRLLKEKSE